jgi:tetratricopeptide (TPR) repeat protein
MQPGRNDPCPCGSGKRYKHCCGRIGGEPPPLQTTAVAELRALRSLLEAGNLTELERRARDLTTLDPRSGGAWKALGVALALQQKDALSALQRAAQLLPEDAQAHANLGGELLRAARYADAVASLRRAVQLSPDDADTLSNLGNALRATGQSDEALESYQAAVSLRPGHAGLHHNLANMLLSLNRPDQAALSYGRALELNPKLPEAHNNLAIALLAIDRPGEALGHAREALQLAPASAAAYSTLGNALLDLSLFGEAADAYRSALALNPDFVDALSNLAIALRLLGQTDEAKSVADRALQLDSRSIRTHIVLADAHADHGEFAESEQWLRRAIAIDPDCAEAWAGLAHLRTMNRGDTWWLEGAQRIAAGKSPNPRLEVQLRYAMGKYFDDLGQYERAFAQYRQANELSRQHRVPYDHAQAQQDTDRLVQTCNRRWLERVRSHDVASDLPVFVVGMPRSGTSLVEQILASHPAVFGAGEQPFWNAAVDSRNRSDFHAAIGPEAVQRLGSDYLALLHGLAADADRVVDKMPENFRHLGLIHAALPGARIIHVSRNPIDTCLSIYFRDFRASLDYATDLDDLAHQYRQYRRLMQHWRELLPPGAMMELSYVALVAEPERWSRRLLEFVALPWDARCLEFAATRRSVVTASKWQVRQKISAASVGRWRNYASHLAPLMPLLQD